MTIRQETPSDYEEVYEMVKTSFATTDYSDGTEQDYLNGIRTKNTFIPSLSLVAEINGKIVGQIVLYEIEIECENGNETHLLLSPLSVHTDYFKQGIGTKLIKESCSRAAALGYKAVFLCGSPAYYERFGFVPTYEHEIYHTKDKTAKWCMVKELEKGCIKETKGLIDIE
jgi:Predicted acetyltransferase